MRAAELLVGIVRGEREPLRPAVVRDALWDFLADLDDQRHGGDQQHDAKDDEQPAGGDDVARNAPQIAPIVVAISRNMPTRRLVMWSLTYAAAAPLEVAMTETIETPIGDLRGDGTRKTSVSSGTTKTPPPRPTSEPTSPATIEDRRDAARRRPG